VWITLIPSLREAEVARLLNHPSSCWVGGATGEVDAPVFEFDEEEHVEAAEGDRFDGEEVAGEHARGLPANERRPARSSAARRGLEPSGGKETPDRARREAKVELDQFTGNPLVAPARVLARELQHQFAQLMVRRWTAGLAPHIRPSPAHQLPMPTQQRRRRHHQPLPAPVWKQSRKRSDECTIGGPKARTLLLASQDRELVPQQHEFHILGELGPSVPNDQPQNSGEGKVGEGEQHRPILPGSANVLTAGGSCVPQPFGTRARVKLRPVEPSPTEQAQGGEPSESGARHKRLPNPRFEPGSEL
jgi:hypothetical protein